MKVGFIGLGNIGYPLAGHLSKAGFEVRVFNRTASKAHAWLGEYAGVLAETPAAAAKEADVVILCVGDDSDVASVAYGVDGVLSAMSGGALLIDHSTVSAVLARELERKCGEKAAFFLDAPVSGGQAGAINGSLSIMVGGSEEAYLRAEPIFDCYARAHKLMGAAGSGQLTKMVNQICVGGLLQGLSEALHFAECNNMDVEAVMDLVGQGAASSWQLLNRYKSMHEREFDFGFAVKWMRKDFAIVLDEARRSGASLPVTAMVDQFYADVDAMGGSDWDTSSLIMRLGGRS